MPKMIALGDQGIQVNSGGAMQLAVPASVHGLPTTIGASGNVTSNPIIASGLQLASIGLTSSQAGAITVQRYLDDGGLVKQGAPITVALTATVAQTLNISDGLPFASFTVNVSNSGGSTANLSNLVILLQAAAGGSPSSSSSSSVTSTSPTVTPTDRSGTITAGGAAQQLAPANSTRRGYRFTNLSANDLWLNDKGGTAAANQPSFKVIAGAMYENPRSGVSGTALSVFGATTGQAFEAAEW